MSLRKETARFHTITHTLIRKPGRPDRRAYVLYVLEGEDCRPQAFLPLVEYVLAQGRSRSTAWQRELARAVGLFVDFLRANQGAFRQQPERPQVLAEFAEALVGGTIDLDANDPSGLYWEPKSLSRATLLLNAVTVFSDWLVNRYDTAPLNPWKTASVAEQMAYWRRFDKRRTHALLSHTYGREGVVERSKLARTVVVRRKALNHDVAPAKFFPQDRIWQLLTEGFAVRGKAKSRQLHERLNIRDMLITILLHGGGLRESEPFHLYVSDVSIDPRNPKSAQVRIYHPERGRAPDDYIDPLSGKMINADREEYLRVKWGLQPRNLDVGRFHAGWKDLKLTNGRKNYALVYWFPSYWGEIFLSLFKVYITKLRSRHCAHPYLFVSHKDTVAGEPYTVDSYRQAHAKAVRRIGLVPRKAYGTTPHGHRHAYAQMLTDVGVSTEVIQAALHHKSQDSQQVYKEPTADKVNSALREASRVIDLGQPMLFEKEFGLCAGAGNS